MPSFINASFNCISRATVTPFSDATKQPSISSEIISKSLGSKIIFSESKVIETD